jgi:hypothetical protein
MYHHKICILLYSHSDYSDVWDVCFGQIYKYINLDDIEIIFCVNNLNNYKIDNRINVLYYNDNLVYTDRILSVLDSINYKYILFLHEDWIITNKLNMNVINTYIAIMEHNNLYHIRSYKNYGPCDQIVYERVIETPFEDNILKSIPFNAENFVSLQPGIWEKNVFKEIYSLQCVYPCNLENKINNDLNWKLRYRNNFYYEYNKNIDAEHSLSFPHIHSVTYGKWELNNSKNLKNILNEYNIDIMKRGIL